MYIFNLKSIFLHKIRRNWFKSPLKKLNKAPNTFKICVVLMSQKPSKNVKSIEQKWWPMSWYFLLESPTFKSIQF